MPPRPVPALPEPLHVTDLSTEILVRLVDELRRFDTDALASRVRANLEALRHRPDQQQHRQLLLGLHGLTKLRSMSDYEQVLSPQELEQFARHVGGKFKEPAPPPQQQPPERGRDGPEPFSQRVVNSD